MFHALRRLETEGGAGLADATRRTVYAVSDEGRLLASGAASPIQTSVAGVVSENRLELGAEVTAGTILVELDNRRPSCSGFPRRAWTRARRRR